MKRIFALFIIIIMLTGCDSQIRFEPESKSYDDFHQINSAEKINEGVLYISGDKIIYEKADTLTQIAVNAHSLWRENDDIYFISQDSLYKYNIQTKEKNKMVDKPYNILGKYDGNIISYYGRSIYSINGTEKTKIFKNGYYLNRAVLYKNKVYGIPATNVYEYNLDKLEVKKVTTDKHQIANLINSNERLYINTVKFKNKEHSKGDYNFYKVTDEGLEKEFTIRNINMISSLKNIKDAMLIATQKKDDDITDRNKLLYVKDGKTKTIDKDYYYEILGIIGDKLLYYKNNYTYGTEQENLGTFYLYDGKENIEAFSLDVGFFEDINGYEYAGGVIIEVNYEIFTQLYNCDGNTVKKIEVPDLFRVSSLDVIDNRIYLNYSKGEEDFGSYGKIIYLVT